MGIAIWALIAYIVAIIVWNGVFKRNIGEAMLLGFLVVCVFGGGGVVELVFNGIAAAAQESIVFAALAFVFMGFLLTRTGLIDRQVDMLNSLLGKFRGGAGYVATIASALFGAVSGSGSGNSAAVGSVTIPWMQRSNWTPERSATLVAGNAGLGIAIPPSSSLFLLVGTAAVAPFVTAGQLFLGLIVGGLWTVLYRLALVFMFVRIDGIQAVAAGDLTPIRQSFSRGWTSILVFLGIIIPVLLTVGPGAAFLTSSIGADAFDTIDIIVWIPVLVTVAGLIIGWRSLPRSVPAWSQLLGDVAPRYSVVGATIFFAFAAAGALTELGLSDQLTAVLGNLSAPPFIVAMLVGVLVVAVAAPLTATATIAAIGGVAFTALVAAGIDPLPAAVAVLIFASTEGASPPGAAPIYIASGIAQVNPAKTFVPLVIYYVLPILLIGSLIAIGAIPIFF